MQVFGPRMIVLRGCAYQLAKALDGEGRSLVKIVQHGKKLVLRSLQVIAIQDLVPCKPCLGGWHNTRGVEVFHILLANVVLRRYQLNRRCRRWRRIRLG